jgi:hypothetical protein
MGGMAQPTSTNGFVQRLIGAMALDVAIYEEVEADEGATFQAMAVVVLSAAAAGIGATGLGAASSRIPVIIVMALALWASWALLTFEVGARILPTAGTRANVGQLLRTIGFSTTPGLLLVIGAIPAAAVPAFSIVAIWLLVTMVYAVKRALDYTSTARAVAVCLFGWTLAAAIAIVMGVLFGPTVS